MRTRRPGGVSLGPRAGEDRCPRSTVRQVNFILIHGTVSYLFYIDLQLIGWGPPTLRKTICFIQSTNSNVNLNQKHSPRHTQNNVWPNIRGPHGLFKLTHKINPSIWPFQRAIISFFFPILFFFFSVHEPMDWKIFDVLLWI